MGVIRKTRSVGLLLEAFHRSSGAISVVSLVERLKDQMNKSTIYRVLDKLEDDGVLHSFLGRDGITWYAMCDNCTHGEHHDVHPHFECLSCGQIECLEIEVNLPSIPNRQVLNTQILIQGRCESCA